jgi:hypothetical protein
MWSLETISIYRWLKTNINKTKEYASKRERPRNIRTEIWKKIKKW